MAPMDGSNLNTGQSLDDSLTAFSGANATFIAEIYERYLQDPTSVDPDWQVFFEAFDDEGFDYNPIAFPKSCRFGSFGIG